MSGHETDTRPEPEQEPFEQVLARARAKARGMRLTPRNGAKPVPYAERSHDEFQAMIQRIRENVKRGGSADPAPPREPKSAGEIRCEWYIPKRHRFDVLHVCTNPVPTPGLPQGRCACKPWHHYVPQNAAQETAFRAAVKWVEQTAAGSPPCLALVGEAGTGKSHLLYAAVRELNITHDLNAGAWGWGDLAAILRSAKFRGNDEAAHAQALYDRDRLNHVVAIGIDEIRPTSGTDYDATELSQLMTRAYREVQGLFVTTNFADRDLEGIIGLAASSRLTQLSITGPDYRKLGHGRAKA